MGNSPTKHSHAKKQSQANESIEIHSPSDKPEPHQIDSKSTKFIAPRNTTKRSQSLKHQGPSSRPFKRNGTLLNDPPSNDGSTSSGSFNAAPLLTRSLTESNGRRSDEDKKPFQIGSRRSYKDRHLAPKRQASFSALQSINSLESEEPPTPLFHPTGLKSAEVPQDIKSKSAMSFFTKSLKKEPSISAAQIFLIKESWESSPHGELGTRIYSRLFQKRPDIRRAYDQITEARPNYNWKIESREFTNFIDVLVYSLDQMESVQIRCWERGRSFAALRDFGFKPQFWVPLSEIMTTECLYLDRGLHPVADVIDAWACFISLMLTFMRDGFYNELRNQRRESKHRLFRADSLATRGDDCAVSASSLAKAAIESTKDNDAFSLFNLPPCTFDDENLECSDNELSFSPDDATDNDKSDRTNLKSIAEMPIDEATKVGKGVRFHERLEIKSCDEIDEEFVEPFQAYTEDAHFSVSESLVESRFTNADVQHVSQNQQQSVHNYLQDASQNGQQLPNNYFQHTSQLDPYISVSNYVQHSSLPSQQLINNLQHVPQNNQHFHSSDLQNELLLDPLSIYDDLRYNESVQDEANERDSLQRNNLMLANSTELGENRYPGHIDSQPGIFHSQSLPTSPDKYEYTLPSYPLTPTNVPPRSSLGVVGISGNVIYRRQDLFGTPTVVPNKQVIKIKKRYSDFDFRRKITAKSG